MTTDMDSIYVDRIKQGDIRDSNKFEIPFWMLLSNIYIFVG